MFPPLFESFYYRYFKELRTLAEPDQIILKYVDYYTIYKQQQNVFQAIC